MSDTSEKIVSLPIKTFVSLIVAIIAITLTIGGYKKMLDDFAKVESKIDKMQEDITSIKIQTARIEVKVNTKNEPAQ